MQLDIFADSRDTLLRNDVVTALRQRDANAFERAFAALTAEFGKDPLLPALATLGRHLAAVAPFRSAAEAAQAAAALDSGLLPAAAEVFRGQAGAWLAPLWRELGRAAAGLAFDSRNPGGHAACFALRAGDWQAAVDRVAGIESWRRQPQPLAWMAEALCRAGDGARPEGGFAAAWPLLAELAWLSPDRLAALCPRLDVAPLAALWSRFEHEFEAAEPAAAWFPAWSLIAEPALAEGIRRCWPQSDSTPERAARLLLELLSLERQGRQRELVAGRGQLRALDAGLFAFYMQAR